MVAAGLGLGGCNREPVERPAPVAPVSQMVVNTLAEGCWKSKEYFIYTEDGEEKVSWASTLWEMKQGIHPSTYACGIGIFSCTPQGSIDHYTSCTDDRGKRHLQVYRRADSLYFNLDGGSVRLLAHRPYAENSIYNNVNLRLQTLEPDRIEFDMDINAVIRAEWALFIPLQNTIGVRVVFTPVPDEQLDEHYVNPHNLEELPLIPVR